MNYHVLDSDWSGDTIRVAFHLAVPAGNNVAGKSWATCIVEDASIVKTSVVPSLGAAEQTALSNGSLIEWVESVHTHPDLTTLQKQGQVDAVYTRLAAEIQGKVTRRYWAWGYSRNVA